MQCDAEDEKHVEDVLAMLEGRYVPPKDEIRIDPETLADIKKRAQAYLNRKALEKSSTLASALPPSALPPSALPPSALSPSALSPSALSPSALSPSVLSELSPLPDVCRIFFSSDAQGLLELFMRAPSR
jgi:hypothetical protein